MVPRAYQKKLAGYAPVSDHYIYNKLPSAYGYRHVRFGSCPAVCDLIGFRYFKVSGDTYIVSS